MYVWQTAQLASQWSVPLLILTILVYAHWAGVKVYESFVVGAATGVQTALRITPFLIAMWTAVTPLRSSGALETLLAYIEPLFRPLRIPLQILPLAIIRPLSGSGALSLMSELMHTYGPDSQIGTLACIIQGSTETTFYIATVYLGAVGVRKARHSIAAALVGDVIGFLAAILAWRLFFR